MSWRTYGLMLYRRMGLFEQQPLVERESSHILEFLIAEAWGTAGLIIYDRIMEEEVKKNGITI